MEAHSRIAMAVSLTTFAAMASADISYTDIDSGDVAAASGLVLADGFPTLFDFQAVSSGTDLLNAAQQTFNTYYAFDPASNGAVSGLTGSASVSTQASNSMYSLDWNYEYAATFAAGLPFDSVIGFGSNMRLTHGINLAAGQTYEISWNGAGTSDFTTDFGTNLSSLFVALTAANGSINDFVFGFNHPNATVTAPFTFQFTTAVAEQLIIDLDSQISVGVEEGTIVTSATASQWGSFSIRVIPTPAGSGLLAIAGLTACRRRRA